MKPRTKKPVTLADRRRPAWNRESDYWLREKARLDLIETIRAESDGFSVLDHSCPGCDTQIWQAHKGDMVYRGCHCTTLIIPPRHRLYVFDLVVWAQMIREMQPSS